MENGADARLPAHEHNSLSRHPQNNEALEGFRYSLLTLSEDTDHM